MKHTLTTERIREIAELRSPSLRWGEAEQIATELLANREVQPVAEIRNMPVSSSGKRPAIYWFGKQDCDLPIGTKFYTAPPAPAVPELITEDEQEEAVNDGYADSFRGGWNACRAAMLAAAPEGGNEK